jgi:hypothetical protein
MFFARGCPPPSWFETPSFIVMAGVSLLPAAARADAAGPAEIMTNLQRRRIEQISGDRQPGFVGSLSERQHLAAYVLPLVRVGRL